MTSMRRTGGLIAACHPLPCLAVTAFAAGWAISVGLPGPRVLLVAGAVLLGQLSVGWCNDWVDAPRDTAAGRRDKPVPRGLVSRRAVGVAALLAAIACVVASFALGLLPGAVHVTAVASAWAYDLGLKSTVASAIPYAVSFGLLPAVVTTALPVGQPGAGWPAPGVVVGAGLLGIAAHFANTVGDVEADAATGVAGLPQRLGPRRSLQVTAIALSVAAAALLTATGRSRPSAVGLLVAGAVTAAAVAVAGERVGRLAFRVILLAVALVIAGFLLST